jgi:hypothetical protein
MVVVVVDEQSYLRAARALVLLSVTLCTLDDLLLSPTI